MVTMYELCERDVINVTTGANLGRVDDLVIEEETAAVQELVVYGRLRWFGLLGREDDTHIPWRDIVRVGEDVILVRTDQPQRPKKTRNPIKF